MRSISAKAMVIAGDTDDVRPERTLAVFKLRGGGDAGAAMSRAGVPAARLVILPTTRVGIFWQSAVLVPMVSAFLDDVTATTPDLFQGDRYPVDPAPRSSPMFGSPVLPSPFIARRAVLMQRETSRRVRRVGKVVLVVGATSGIGAAVARRVTAEGAAVVAAGRRAELGEHLVTEVRVGGGEGLFVTCDATVEDDVAAAVHAAVGHLHGAVNNAGGVVAPGPLDQPSPLGRLKKRSSNRAAYSSNGPGADGHGRRAVIFQPQQGS